MKNIFKESNKVLQDIFAENFLQIFDKFYVNLPKLCLKPEYFNKGLEKFSYISAKSWKLERNVRNNLRNCENIGKLRKIY